MATYKGLHYTLEEARDLWYPRAMSGNYPGWTRIVTRKNSFVSNPAADRFNNVYQGSLNSPVPAYSPAPNNAAEKLRDAAFWALVMAYSPTGSVVTAANALKRTIILEIINNIINATYDYKGQTLKTFDFLGTPGRWPLQGGSDVSPHFELAEYGTRILYAWDYVKDQATPLEQATFNDFIKGFTIVIRSYYEKTIDDLFVSRTGTPGTYTVKPSLAAEELAGQVTINGVLKVAPFLHSGYKRAHKIGRTYGNRRRMQAMFVGLSGTFLGYQPFISSADRFFKEYFCYAVYPDLSYCDFLRSHDTDSAGHVKACHGYSYSIPIPLVMYADARARVGDTSLYDYETTLGTTTSQSGAGNSSDGSSVKGLLRHMKLLNQMHAGTVLRYSPNDGTSVIGPIDLSGKENVQYFVYRVANLYYHDTTLNSFITRADPSTSIQQPNGPANPYNVGQYPDITLMFSGYGNVPTLNRFPTLEPDPEVPKVPQVITVTDPADRAYQPGETFAITATAPGGAVTITKVSGPGTLAGNVVTVTGAGTFTFTFNQAGNSTYLAAPQTTTHVVIRKADQTLSFNAIPDQTMPGSVNIVFSSSSGLTPIATSDNAHLTKVDADTFTLTSAGPASITVTQPGDANYNAATPITRTFTVAPVGVPTGITTLLTEGRDSNGDLYPNQPTTVPERITVGSVAYYRWTTTWPAFDTPKYLSGLLMKTGRQTGKLVFNNRLKSYRYEVLLVGAGANAWTPWVKDTETQKNDIDRGISINNVIQVRRIVEKQDPTKKIQSTEIYGRDADDGGDSYTLTSSAKTSAGVYNASGVLVRTLWSGTTKAAGNYPIAGLWDGKDDAGASVATGSYALKVMANNVAYTWEGVIGNTSTVQTGPTKVKSYEFYCGMTVLGSNVYFCADYGEGISPLFKSAVTNVQIRNEVLPSTYPGPQSAHYVCTDGTTVFWGGLDPFAITNSFVIGTRVSNDTEQIFTSGAALTPIYGFAYSSAICHLNSANSAISGMAVQTTGNYLFVARKGLNNLYVHNRTTGALVRTLSFTNVRGISITPDSASLWLITGTNTATKYTINGDGTLTTTGVTLSGLVAPIASAVSPDGATVIVSDGSTSQQVKAYSNSTGASSWTLGQAGGYASTPTVASDRFMFNGLGERRESGFLAFQPDGSFWVGDGGNQRVQHFNSARTFTGQVAYNRRFYNVAVDLNNVTRVFADYLEYAVDYTKTLSPTNGSWRLVKNWSYGLTSDDQFFKLRRVATLSNGRTYAFRGVTGDAEMIELTATGVRNTGVLVGVSSDMDASGHLYRANGLPSNVQQYTKRALTGFNGSGNPTYGSETTIYTTAARGGTDPYHTAYGMADTCVLKTSSNILIQWQTGLGNTYHLGGMKLGVNDNALTYQWKTAKAVNSSSGAAYPSDGRYEIGNGVTGPGNKCHVFGRSILWGYNGEFWNSGQANKYSHYYDNGLFVNTFGQVRDYSQKAVAGMAGNSFSNIVINNPANTAEYFLYHNDESDHGGVHRWRISGMETIQEFILAVTV